jgi:hypothetical protein
MFGMMPVVQNSLMIRRVIEGLFTVVGRRTLDSHAIKVIQTVLKKLEPTYHFLDNVVIHDELFSHDGIKMTINPMFDEVNRAEVGKAVDALIQVISMDLVKTAGEEVGLYFITELKGHLGDEILDDLRDRGVNLDLLQKVNHQQHQAKAPEFVQTFSEEEEAQDMPYSWETVSSWKYDNNVCMLYDDSGKLLDTIQLDLLIEDYVRRVVETANEETKPVTQSFLQVTAQEDAFLEMLKQRDIDVEYAMTLLHISQQKLHTMIQKLLQLEMLTYISDNEVKLTEKGLQHLLEKKTDESHESFNGPIK